MPVMDQGPVDVMLRIRHRISAKEGNRGNMLCRFNRNGVLAAALIGAGRGIDGGQGGRKEGMTNRF